MKVTFTIMKQISSSRRKPGRDNYRRTTVALPPSLYERITALAKADERSINKQIVLLLEQGLRHQELAEERRAAFRRYAPKVFGGLTTEELEALARGTGFAADAE